MSRPELEHTGGKTRVGRSAAGATRYNRIEVLLDLVVENYVVVERLRIRFRAGLNLPTGETGSGKSRVVDALGLLLGGGASARRA